MTAYDPDGGEPIPLAAPRRLASKRRSAMHEEFNAASIGHDWLSFIGQPMLYDGGLFVTRESDEASSQLPSNSPKKRQRAPKRPSTFNNSWGG